MRLTLVTMPPSMASMMPRLTPGLWPKSSALTMSRRSAMPSRLIDQPVQDSIGVEVLTGDCHSSLRVAGGVRCQPLDRVHRLFHRSERKHAPANRDGTDESRALHPSHHSDGGAPDHRHR